MLSTGELYRLVLVALVLGVALGVVLTIRVVFGTFHPFDQ